MMKTPNIVFLNKTHDDAAKLLQEIRDYMRYQHAHDAEALSPVEALRVHCESTRITTRLTYVMSGMALLQAIQKGLLTLEEIQDKRLGFPSQKDYLDYRSDQDLRLPSRLRSLLVTSHTLYTRMARLNQRVH